MQAGRLRQVPGEQADEVGLAVEQIADHAASAPAQAAQDAQRKIIGAALQIALRSLSQKSIIALASLYSLLLAGAVFWIFMNILANPTVLQLVGAGMFCLFVLMLHLVRRNG